MECVKIHFNQKYDKISFIGHKHFPGTTNVWDFTVWGNHGNSVKWSTNRTYYDEFGTNIWCPYHFTYLKGVTNILESPRGGKNVLG